MIEEKPRILIVDDERTNINALGAILADDYEVSVAMGGAQALDVAGTTSTRPELILLDVMMPGMDGYETCRHLKSQQETRDITVIFVSALEQTQSKVDGFKAGAVDFVTKPLQAEEVLARVRAHLTLRQQMRELEQKNRELDALYRKLLEETEQRQQAEANFHAVDAKLNALSEREAKKWGLLAFVGRSQEILALQGEIRRLHAADRTNVLVLGESGTGKELVARALHFGSGRAKNPFIAVNCSAIPNELADAIFFGSVKGAYTGSIGDRKGYFEEADSGTLFLDEIGDMPLSLQAKLLRTLEEGNVTPVGGVKEKAIDVRIVAATNVDLAEQIAAKAFRQDLYYRLAGYSLQISPLRQRVGDIELLARHFVHQYVEEMGLNPVEIGSDALAVLKRYAFPGNVRELRNLMEYALIRSGGHEISAAHLPLLEPMPAPAPAVPSESSHSDSTTQVGVTTAEPLAGRMPEILDISAEEQTILNYLAEHQRINNRQCQKLLDVNHSRASYLLKKLHRQGDLIRHGERRWAYYSRPSNASR